MSKCNDALRDCLCLSPLSALDPNCPQRLPAFTSCTSSVTIVFGRASVVVVVVAVAGVALVLVVVVVIVVVVVVACEV